MNDELGVTPDEPTFALRPDRAFFAIKSIPGIVDRAMDARVQLLASRIEPLEHDPGFDHVADAMFEHGFNNRSADVAKVHSRILALRGAGKLCVFEAADATLGTIDGNDIGHGYLNREGLLVLLDDGWPGLASAMARESPTEQGDDAPTTPAVHAEAGLTPVQRGVAQERAIIAKLAELGFNAQALPHVPAGKRSPAKQAVRKALGYSLDVMNKAWLRLRKTAAIKDASP